MIVAGQLLLESTDHPGACRTAPGFVRIEDDRIAEVVELFEDELLPAHPDAGGADCLVTPGFVDAHLHLPQFDMIGAHGLPLLEWLRAATYPHEARWADPDYAAGMASRVAEQLLAHGTTSLCAYSTVHREGTARAIDELTAAGLTGWVGQSLSNRDAPAELLGETAALLDDTAQLLEAYPASAPVSAAITPRFAVSCDDALLAGCGELARRHPDAIVQTHLSETRAECELVRQVCRVTNYTEAYERAGLLTPRTVFGHAIWLDAGELQAIHDARSVIAHCPTANSFLRSGAMDRAERLDSGVRLALGSDIGAGYERSMVRVARAMIETAAAVGDAYPSAAQAWRQITAGSADALGMPAGRLAEGARADLVVVEPDVRWRDAPDPLAMLLFAWDDRWISHTLAGGRVAYGG